MEFYRMELQPLDYRDGFNSQRDGILLYSFCSCVTATRFQFPTGWNSTSSSVEILTFVKMFQFPTGWNSTESSDKKILLRSKFQFPTGWNSTPPCIHTEAQAPVSIPNGMEFYKNREHDASLREYVFQFPTGWNSTG